MRPGVRRKLAADGRAGGRGRGASLSQGKLPRRGSGQALGRLGRLRCLKVVAFQDWVVLGCGGWVVVAESLAAADRQAALGGTPPREGYLSKQLDEQA